MAKRDAALIGEREVLEETSRPRGGNVTGTGRRRVPFTSAAPSVGAGAVMAWSLPRVISCAPVDSRVVPAAWPLMLSTVSISRCRADWRTTASADLGAVETGNTSWPGWWREIC